MNRLVSVVERIVAPKTECVHLPCPKYEDKHLKSFTSGLRPFRVDGIRMEKQIVDGKSVYHNYGHGGGGISLSYGCAEHVVSNLFQSDRVPKGQKIAVLGAGIIGLTTAYLLTLQGYSVNIYYDTFPMETSTQKPEITSTVAAGYWMPLKITNREKMSTISARSFNYYKALEQRQFQTGEELGVTGLMAYCINDDQCLSYYQIPGVIHPQPIFLDWGDGELLKGVKFPTFVVETHKYLSHLIREIKKTNLAIFKKTHLSRESIFEMKETHLFNCLGLNGGKIFGDKSEMIPIKGTVCRLQLEPNMAVKDYLLFLKTPEGRWILQVPHVQQNSLKLGINFDEGNGDPRADKEEAMRVFMTAKNYFDKVASNIYQHCQ